MHRNRLSFLRAGATLGARLVTGFTYRSAYSLCRCQSFVRSSSLRLHQPASFTTIRPEGASRLLRSEQPISTPKMMIVSETNEESKADQTAMLAKGKLIMQKLEEVYPKAPEGFLDHTDAFTLLIAVVLSAQSLDIKVNEITPKLFRVGGTPKQMRDLGEVRIKEIIKQIGLAPQKAKNIAKLSAMLCDEFDGNVPNTFEDLEKLPGVGHKTASVVMMQAFKKPAFPVDTHIHRLACRWGCGTAKSVEKTEASLKKWFPDPNSWGELHTRIILFGREYCPAKKHNMDECPICSFAATTEARRSNAANPNKFVAPTSHKNPFSIRTSSNLDPVNGDPPYQPGQVESGPAKKKKPTKRRESSAKKRTAGSSKVDDMETVKTARVGRRSRKVTTKESAEQPEYSESDVAPKRSKRSRTTAKRMIGSAEAEEPVGDEPPSKKGRGRPRNNKKPNSATTKTGQRDGSSEVTATRSSTRLRARRGHDTS